MRNTNCIFNWSDNPEPCKNKTEYSGNVYGKPDERGHRMMPMIDFEFCKEHYQEGQNDPKYIFRNVKKL
tara:strand:+ start:327 stop:533 length:207 start_codon:yes stop_codon:yes gene_type:complete